MPEHSGSNLDQSLSLENDPMIAFLSARSFRAAGLAAALLLPSLFSCQSAYYATMEKFGVHKRDILVDRVEDGREAQADAQEQFKTTYEVFKELTGVEGGELEKVYGKLKSEYEQCSDEAEEVTERIDSIESVAEALFTEWEAEIGEYTNQDLARQSRADLDDTRKRADSLVGVMRKAAAQMDPVLAKFKDNVLFLKHNLNARAIAGLQDTVLDIGGDIERLIGDMERSIAEADDFIKSMSSAS